MRDTADLQLEHTGSRLCIGQMNVNSLLEATTERLIKLPRRVGRTHSQDAVSCFTATVHLNEEFSLDTSRRFSFIFLSLTAERVDLIDEDKRRLLLASHLEQVSHELFRLTLPLAD